MIGSNKIWYGKSDNVPIELVTSLNAGDIIESQMNPSDYYVFTLYENGLLIVLLDDFKTALNKANPSEYKNWNPSDPLPALPSEYNGKPVISLADMFKSYSSAIGIDCEKFDTSNVTNMANMFSGCESALNINTSNFDTNKVTSMSGMFSGCKKTKNIDVSNFNTSNVTNMANMFYGCSVVNILDVSNFNTSNVTNMANMFSGCVNINTLDLSKWEFCQVHAMTNFLNNTPKLTTIKVKHKGDGAHIKWAGKGSGKIYTTTESIPNPIVPDSVGETFNWNGFRWLVCHIDSSKQYKYCIVEYSVCDTIWNTAGSTSGGYAASSIKKECNQFAIDSGIDQLDYVVNTGVGKVFIPTKKQMEGGFSWFNSDNKRNIDDFYWTATPYDSNFLWVVTNDGDLSHRVYQTNPNSNVLASFGFRPCIAIQY